jgi:uncharacterized ion transporter superfamily protein YfcC
MKLKKIKAPNTFIIIFSLIVITAGLTWIIPGGEYQRREFEGRKAVVNGSFKYVEGNPQGIDDIFMAPIKGFVDASLIIGLVFIVGGAFGVFKKTEAIDSLIYWIAKAHQKSSFLRMALIPVVMIIFSLAGAVFGMSEEVIPFILIFIPLSLILGYDSIVGVAMPFVGAGAGFAGAFFNPFTIGIAQEISGLTLFSGLTYRIIVWLIVTTVAITFVLFYAKKIKKNPAKSPTYESDIKKRESLDLSKVKNHKGIETRHKLVLVTFIAGIAVLIFGVLKYKWFIEELAAVFFATGIAVGIVGKLSVGEITKSFIDGAKDLIATALIIGLARGILIISQDGKIIDTILNYLSAPISYLHPIVSSQAMFLVQTFINFFVPSGSGQAVLTMPIMAPLSDLVGVSRQTAVLAFQFGDGFSNMIIPTSAVTMGVLSLSEIPWEKWAKWILPLELLFFIVGLLLLVPPFFMNWI